MVVVSREDPQAPRALSLCVSNTTAYRESPYDAELPSMPFLGAKSYANVQGLQAIEHHELEGSVGLIFGEVLERIGEALRHALDIQSG